MTPTDPRHGKRAGYLAGCRDKCCRTANLRDVKSRELRVLREGPQRVQAADAITEIVRYWEIRGVSIEALSRAAGVNRDVLAGVYSGNRERTLLRSLRKVIAVNEDSLPDDALVYAELSRVRVFSMLASGHPLKWICEQSPLLQYAGNWRRQERIRAGMARAIRDLYDRVPAVGPSKFTRSRSKNYGYLPIAAWDDPGALTMPRGWQPEAIPVEIAGADIDEVRVERRLAGDRKVELNRAERTAVVQTAIAHGKSYRWIEEITGLKPERYRDKTPKRVDKPADQKARQADLLEAVDAFEKDPGRKRPTRDDEPVKLVLRKGIWVADRSAA